MSNSWDEMRKAKENEYFEKRNSEALKRLSKKKEEKPRLSPITGEPMEQVVVEGVVIDRCPKSGGVWLDAGELEELIASAIKKSPDADSGVIGSFMKGLLSFGK